MPERKIKLLLPESALTNVREALDHHVKAMVWRVHNRPHPIEKERAQQQIDQTNATLDLIEKQMRQ